MEENDQLFYIEKRHKKDIKKEVCSVTTKTDKDHYY